MSITRTSYKVLFLFSWSLLLLLNACGTPANTIDVPKQAPTVATAPVREHTTLYINTNHTERVNAIAWSPNGKYIASGSADQMVQVIEALTGKRVATLTGHTGAVQTLAWSPDSSRIASGSQDMTVRVWNATTGANVLTYKEHTGAVYGVAWSPDGTYLAFGDAFGKVQVWQPATIS